MGIKSKLPEVKVADLEVAPHRYRWDDASDWAFAPQTYKEVKAASPYKAGDVIYVVYGDSFAKAYVQDVFCDRDYYGDLREYYMVRRETQKGTFAHRAYKVHPGHVQRGYHRAGLATEIPEGALV